MVGAACHAGRRVFETRRPLSQGHCTGTRHAGNPRRRLGERPAAGSAADDLAHAEIGNEACR